MGLGCWVLFIDWISVGNYPKFIHKPVSEGARAPWRCPGLTSGLISGVHGACNMRPLLRMCARILYNSVAWCKRLYLTLLNCKFGEYFKIICDICLPICRKFCNKYHLHKRISGNVHLEWSTTDPSLHTDMDNSILFSAHKKLQVLFKSWRENASLTCVTFINLISNFS